MLLENKVAVVTGAARGIGYAIAQRFAGEGARVVIADIDDAGAAVAADLGRHGTVRFVECDVGERLDVRNLVTAAAEAFGQIDVLVNCAEIMHVADFLELEEADFDRVLRTNLKGAFLCGQAVARHMVERVNEGGKPGAIVNLTSVSALMAVFNQVPHAISKGGIDALTRVMALALAPHGIRVNGIAPGTTTTEVSDALLTENADVRRHVLSRTPLGRIGEPKEIAALAAFLASDEASYITGQTVYADGGRLVLNYTMPPTG